MGPLLLWSVLPIMTARTPACAALTALLLSGAAACAPQLQASPSAALASPTKVQAGQVGSAPYTPDAAYVESLVARAHAVHLSDDVQWRRLGRYRDGVFGVKSEADGQAFFAAPNGSTDPAAELDATLRGFFTEPTATAEHPLCHFAARRMWLTHELSIDTSKLPSPSCEAYDRFVGRAGADSVSLIFSSYYLNNPASMFGHTFLRFNRAEGPADEGRRALLDQGVDYSASVRDDENKLLYVFKGLTGLYPGIFRMLPYYYKVREYNDAESRDLWEYDLALSDDERHMLVAHLWELGHTYFDYFYLDENCSYHVLSALETTSRRLSLTDRVHWPIIPADTIRAVMEVPGLVKQIRYRPSAKAIFRARMKTLPGDWAPLVATLGSDASAALPPNLTPDQRGQVLDAAIDYVEMAHAKDILADDRTSRGAALKQRLLERRAELDAETHDLVITPPVDEMPHRGHASSRMSFGGGVLDGARGGRPARGFFQIDYRIAAHDLSDAPAGYSDTSQLEFLGGRVRFDVPRQRLWVEEVTLLRAVTLNPVDRFFMKPSFKVRVGATTFRDDRCAECTMGAVEVGSGAALALANNRILAWAMADVGFYGVRFAGESPDSIRVQVGPSAGLRVKLTERLVWLTTGSVSWLPFQGSPHRVHDVTSIVRWQPVTNWSVSAEGHLQPQSTQLLGTSAFYF